MKLLDIIVEVRDKWYEESGELLMKCKLNSRSFEEVVKPHVSVASLEYRGLSFTPDTTLTIGWYLEA